MKGFLNITSSGLWSVCILVWNRIYIGETLCMKKQLPIAPSQSEHSYAQT